MQEDPRKWWDEDGRDWLIVISFVILVSLLIQVTAMGSDIELLLLKVNRLAGK